MIGRLFGVVVVMVSLAGCATAISSGYGQGGQNNHDGRSYTEAYADNQLSATVMSRLVRDSRVTVANIQVSTRDGVVTLSGSVPSATQASRAASLAASVDGVRRVVNRLAVQ